MSQYLVSEEQVKKALQIDSFRNLSKDKIMEFASLIPHMDKDIAVAIINQFPAYVESSRNMIEQYNAMCDKVFQSNEIIAVRMRSWLIKPFWTAILVEWCRVSDKSGAVVLE